MLWRLSVNDLAARTASADFPGLLVLFILYLRRGHSVPDPGRREGHRIRFFLEAASVWMMLITAYWRVSSSTLTVKEGDFVISFRGRQAASAWRRHIANYAGAAPIALTRTSATSKSAVCTRPARAHFMPSQSRHRTEVMSHHERKWRTRKNSIRRTAEIVQAGLAPAPTISGTIYIYAVGSAKARRPTTHACGR